MVSFKVFLMVALSNGASMTQISLARLKVSENLEVWFYRQSSMTEKIQCF